VDGIVAAARSRRLPLAVVDLDDQAAAATYAKKLVLVRPDRHVAWRGDAEPTDAAALIDHLRGVPMAAMPSVAAE
jgi:hypothetical protein